MLERSLPTQVFREYDIRGLADSEITEVFAAKLARAYLRFLPENTTKPIVVARDVRLSGKKLQQAVMLALLNQGYDVIDIAMKPTPIAYYAVHQLDAAGCIMVTASHNPSEYNGFKMMVGCNSFHGQDIQKLKAFMQQDVVVPSPKQGKLEEIDVIPAYEKFVVEDCKLQRPLKVVIDAGNGPAGMVAAPVFKAMGCEVLELFCEPDGRFPNHHPDPTVEENLRDLKEKVIEAQADLGLAFDGDGDRLGVVDEKGQVIWGDMLLLLLSRQLLKQHPQATIISEVKSSQSLYDDITDKGGIAIMGRTGHSLMKAKMKETGALLAGEMSGHFFFADRYYGFDDATYAGARLMQLLAEQQRPLSTLLEDVPKQVSTPEIRMFCADDIKFKIVEKAKQYFTRQQCEIIDVDGIRLRFEKGWALLRASNTQPALVMRFEAQDIHTLNMIKDKLEKWLASDIGGEYGRG